MPLVTRRRFIQGSAITGGAVLGSQFLFGGPETLVRAHPAEPTPAVDEMIPTACWIGKQDCGMLARRVDGRVVKFEGDPTNPRNIGTLCPKGQAQITSLYDPNRVTSPLVRTNDKGQTGEWRQVSWDEALDMVAEHVKSVSDSKLVLWQKGRSKAKEFYDEAFVDALDITKMGHGGYCSDAGYRALEYTVGVHGVLHPDFDDTNYLLSWGWNITNAGGNKFCWLTWPQQMVAAKERGMKLAHIDPRLRGAGPFADEWVPVRPGTDLALALALCNVLIEEGFVDTDYLKRYTNAAFLVKDDGTVVRVDDTEQVWDNATSGPLPLDQAGDPALEGTFAVDGEEVRPAFELFKEHVASSTPEWAADICGVPAEQIRNIAVEFGENAQIGSTTVVDGVEIPYRPVAIMAYHMAQQELGFEALRAMAMVSMLVGAFGAVGGQMIDFKWEIDDHYEEFGEVDIEDPPYDFQLKHSKFFPINSALPGIVAKVMADPERYEVEDLPEVAILHMVNPLGAFPDQAAFIDTWGKHFKFVVDINPWLSETADYFADVILPAATLEKYEGPLSAGDQYIDGKSMRLPVMDPLGESKGEIDIYLDLTEKLDALFGEEGYLAFINEALELEGDFALPLDTKPTPRDILDTWARMEELEGGIEFFEKNGTWDKGPLSPEKRYGYVTVNDDDEPDPFGGALHRLYGESLLLMQQAMKEKGADEIYWQDYTALPTWREPTMAGSPSDYDLNLISFKLVEYKQSRSTFLPLLAELVPEQRLDINPETAKERGIDDGSEVSVESHNAVTDETRKLKVRAVYNEGIRPDTVGMPHHFGLWANPEARDRGPSPNEILYTGEGYVTNTADQSYHVKVRVDPVGGGS